MVGPTINLISGTHHSCERREHAFIVLWEYTIIFLWKLFVDLCRVRGWQVITFFFIKCWFCSGTIVSVNFFFCFVGKLRTNRERETPIIREEWKCNVSSELFFCTLWYLFYQNHQCFSFFNFFFKGRPLIISFLTNETKCGQNSNVIFFLIVLQSLHLESFTTFSFLYGQGIIWWFFFLLSWIWNTFSKLKKICDFYQQQNIYIYIYILFVSILWGFYYIMLT